MNRKFVLHELKQALEEVGADLVFLQEVLGEHQRYAVKLGQRWPQKSQYEFLADQLWHSWAYGRNAVYPGGHHGNAILSRYEIVHWFNTDVSQSELERRGILYSHIRVGEHNLHAICVHFGLRERDRQLQLHALANIVNRLPVSDPVVVAGDFNDWRQRAHELLRERCELIEVFKAQTGKALKTFPAALPLLSLDRIYMRAHAIYQLPQASRKPWAALSDHRPLVADIEF